MSNFLSKYGKHFWIITLIPCFFSWYQCISRGLDLDYFISSIFFSAFSYYFFLRGTGKLTDDNDPFV